MLNTVRKLKKSERILLFRQLRFIANIDAQVNVKTTFFVGFWLFLCRLPEKMEKSRLPTTIIWYCFFATSLFCIAVRAELAQPAEQAVSKLPAASVCVLSTLNDVVKQIEDLKSNRVPPSAPHPTQVTIQVLPLRLINVDDAKSRVEIDMSVYLLWKGTRLAWTNFQHNTSSACELPENVTLSSMAAVWSPPFAIVESTASTARATLEQRREQLTVWDSGQVVYGGKFIHELFCPMQRRLYPFDVQICNITVFGQFVYYARDPFISESK